MARGNKKSGEKPLIETASEKKAREAREAAQAAGKEPEVSHEGGNPLKDKPADAETQVSAQTEELVSEGEDDKSEPEEKEPVQTWGVIKSLWNRLGEFKIVNI